MLYVRAKNRICLPRDTPKKQPNCRKREGVSTGKERETERECEREREKWKDKTRLQMCKQQFPKVSFLLLLLFESESASVSM